MQVLLEELFGSYPQGFCFNRHAGLLFLHRVVAAYALSDVVSAATFATCELQDYPRTRAGILVEQLAFFDAHTAPTSSSVRSTALQTESRADYSAAVALLLHELKERGRKDVC